MVALRATVTQIAKRHGSFTAARSDIDSPGRGKLLHSMPRQHDLQPPPRVPPRIKAAPRIRQIYWCDLPTDAQLPEFWKVRPAVVISFKNTLHGHVTVVPTTTVEQPDNEWAYKLTTLIDGKQDSWAICDKLVSLAVSRLEPRRTIPRITIDELNQIMTLVLKWLPRLT